MREGNTYEATTGQRILYLRDKYGISQSELAELVGTTVEMIKKYEKEIIKKVPYEQIEKMAPVLHTSVGYLLGWEPAMFNASLVAEQAAEEGKLFEEFLDTESEALETFWTMQAKTPEERDEVIATGAFKNHIEGYMVLTLRSIGYPESEINHIRTTLQHKIFGHVTAEDARKAGELMGISVNRSKPAREVKKETADTAVVFAFPVNTDR